MKTHASITAALVIATLTRANAALQISTKSVSLDATHRIETVEVSNLDDDAKVLQVHANHWTQLNGKDVLETTDNLLAIPRVFSVAGHAKQIVRIAVRAIPDGAEDSYRVNVAEVASKVQTNRRVQIQFGFSFPVFVEPKFIVAPRLSWTFTPVDAGHVRVTIQNTGTAHTKVDDVAISTGIDLRTPNFKSPQLEYLLAHQAWSFNVPLKVDRPHALAYQARIGGKTVSGTITPGP